MKVDSAASRRPAAFIDKDGTLVKNVPFNVDPALVVFTPNAIEGLRLLAAHGYRLVIVTNQPGIGTHRFDGAALLGLEQALGRMLADEGLELDGFYACPHAPRPDGRPACPCRKPAPGLIHRAARSLHLDLSSSWMVGDILDDVEAGHRAGCRAVLMDVGSETVWHVTPERIPDRRAADLLEAARHIVAAPCVGESPGLEGMRP